MGGVTAQWADREVFIPDVPVGQVVDERTRMVELMATPTGQDIMDASMRGIGLDARNSDGILKELAESTLWWVSPEMCDVVDVARTSLPPDYRLHPSDVPDPSGLLFFAKPMPGIDTFRPDTPMYISAMQWFPAMRPTGEHILAIAIWTQAVNTFKLWGMVGINYWPLNEPLSNGWSVPADEEAGRGVESGDEDRGRLLATWLLSTQSNVSTVENMHADRATRRRCQRAGLPSTVRVVNLRRPKSHSNGDGSTTVDWSHRWIVSGHWRNQPYGPQRSLRRPVWIAPHIKGPEDAPLIEKTVVKALTP